MGLCKEAKTAACSKHVVKQKLTITAAHARSHVPRGFQSGFWKLLCTNCNARSTQPSLTTLQTGSAEDKMEG